MPIFAVKHPGEPMNPEHVEELQDVVSYLKRKRDDVSLSDVVRLTDLALQSMRAFVGASNGAVMNELREIAEYIESLKGEIGALGTSELRDHRLPAAGMELDAIVSATEKATNSIMECAEAVMAHDAADVESYKAFVEERMLVIFEACSFQDITGQRIAKVVETLHFIESRVARFAEALPMQGGEVKMNDEERAAQERKQRLILHGPQLEGEAMAQDEIDRLLG
jgi:chemotaxis protein CheZ